MAETRNPYYRVAFPLSRSSGVTGRGLRRQDRWRPAGGMGSALATLGLLLAPTSGGAATGPQAGVSAAVRGAVFLKEIDQPNIIGIRADDGASVFLGNSIKSAPAAGMQLMLLDETTVTVGENAELAVDEFVYDPAQNTGKLDIRMAKGTFRLVTGGISDLNPAATTIRTPTATIGIRGTIVLIEVTETGTTVALGGPGSNTDSRERVGAVKVTTAKGTVLITRPGFVTFFAPDGTFSAPRRLTESESADIAYRLTRDGIDTNATVRDVMKGADGAAPVAQSGKSAAQDTPVLTSASTQEMASAITYSGAPLTEGIRQAASSSGKPDIVVAAEFREVENTQQTSYGGEGTGIRTAQKEAPLSVALLNDVEADAANTGTIDYGLADPPLVTQTPNARVILDPTLYQQTAALRRSSA